MTSLDINTWGLSIQDPNNPERPIPCKLIERFGDSDPERDTMTEVYLIPANRLADFIEAAFNFERFGSWQLPAFMQAPGIPNAAAKRVSWKAHVDGLPVDPFDVDERENKSRHYQNIVEVTIEYNTDVMSMPDGDDPQTYLEVSADVAGEILHGPIPAASWDLQGEGDVVNTPVTSPITTVVFQTEWTVTWPSIPYAFYNSTLLPLIRSNMGKVNSLPMPLLHNAAPETVMFMGFNAREQRSAVNAQRRAPTQTLELKFLEKRVEIPGDREPIKGHNHFWKPEHGWRRILVTRVIETDNRVLNVTENVYQSANLNVLFLLTPPT